MSFLVRTRRGAPGSGLHGREATRTPSLGDVLDRPADVSTGRPVAL
jgi:hypothetical protein